MNDLRKFINIVTEARSQEVNNDFLVKNFPKFEIAIEQYKAGNVLYRGLVNNIEPIKYIDPRKSTRKAKNTRNYYNLFLDNLPAWQNYPKRSHAIIATSGKGHAMGYSYDSKIYIVLPIGDPTLAIAPRRDIWNSFEKTLHTKFVDTWSNYFFQLLNFFNQNPRDDDIHTLIQAINNIDQTNSELKNKWLGFFKEGSLLKTIEHDFDPNLNNFQLMKLSKFNVPAVREIWFDVPAILIHQDVLDNFIETEINKNKHQSE